MSTSFRRRYSYNTIDIAVFLSTLEGDSYQKLSEGISHHAVLQFDKQSDELALHRLSMQITD